MKSKTARKRTSLGGQASAPVSAQKSHNAYGGTTPICINTECVLRKKGGGCYGFAGCPGFKAR